MGCFNTKNKRNRIKLNESMRIIGSHTEHHLDFVVNEKASNVKVTAGVK